MALVMAFGMSGASLMVLVSGLLGTHIAPAKNLATLPLAVMVIGTAISAIPASLLMQRIGRKKGMIIGILISIVSSLLAIWAAINAHFYALLFASVGIGANIAFMQTGRFAIIESAQSEKQQATGLSLALLAGLLSAFIGPQIGVSGKELIESPHGYAGSFLLYVIVQLVTLIILIWFKDPVVKQSKEKGTGRPLLQIIRKPAFVIAAGSGAIAFGVMTLVMTATPISMHEFEHHSLESTKWIIQSHLVAMFLPSLLTGILIVRVNKLLCLMLGLVIYGAVSFFAFSGHGFFHYWWALVLLGIGWNILFVTATALLPKAYEGNERFKVQACNDFLVFGFQALASFSAGWLLFSFGWSGVIWVLLILSIPALFLLGIVYLRR
jgi:MFS family permease